MCGIAGILTDGRTSLQPINELRYRRSRWRQGVNEWELAEATWSILMVPSWLRETKAGVMAVPFYRRLVG